MVRTLGPYEIRSKLGRGVAAVFWRAYDPVLEREVALREVVIPFDLDPSVRSEFVDGFLQRGRMAAKLSHPGLVEVYSADVYDGRPVLVTEIVEGEALAHVLARGALSSSSTYYLLDQILDAATYAHGEGVVHEAISPDTVLVTREGRVKIADFGTTGLFAGIPTGRRAAVGPPGYVAPEQIDGAKADHRSDLFSIGVLGYEMLSGVNPFGASEGLSAAAISYRVVHEPPAPLPAEVQAAGPWADPRAVFGAALAKNPDRRFQSAEEFRAALHGGAVPTNTALLAVAAPKTVRLEAEPAVTAVTPGPAPRRARRARRVGGGWWSGRVGLGLTAAALLVACAVGAGLFFGLGDSSSGNTTTTVDASLESTLSSATSSSTTLSTASAVPSSTTVTLVPGTTTSTTLPPATTTSSTTTTTVAPTTTTVAPTTTTVQQTTTTRRPTTTTTRRPTTTTTQPSTTTTTEFVTPTTLGPGQ
ncbi:MAG: serine/threonine protein kinase [Thermoleophilia bacterium]|nr:serine/threonine protein kinase [Thermoleophilia bacterium]